MNLLQAVNTLLKKLRQNPVTTINDTAYAQLLVQFINEARKEVEDTWNWMGLRTTIQVDTIAGYSQYTLAGVGNSRFKILEVVDDTKDHFLKMMSSQELTRRFLFGNAGTGQPMYYGFNGFDDNHNPIVDIYPIPDGVYSINFNMVLPQNDLTLGSDIIKVPSHLVLAGAYLRALAERGEDQTSGYALALSAYNEAVGANIEQESALNVGETDWYPV